MAEKIQVVGGVRAQPKVRKLNKRNARILMGVSALALLGAYYLDPIKWIMDHKAQPQAREMVEPPPTRIDVASLPTDYSDNRPAANAVSQGGVAAPPPMDLNLPPSPTGPKNDLPPPETGFTQGGARTMKAKTVRAPLGFVGDDPLQATNASAQGSTDPAAQYAQMAQMAQGAAQGGQGGGGGRKSRADEFRQSSRGNSMFLGNEPVMLNTRPGWGVIPQGTIIPANLTTATNSELGGNVTARVSADIYDPATGTCLMIDRSNSTLFGTLSDQISYGQNMHQAVWNSLITPKMQLDLKGMDAVDGSGRTGIDSKVNRHYGRLATAVIGATLLDIVGNYAGRGKRGNTEINIGGSVAENAASVGQRLVQRELDVQDTLEQYIGHPVSLMVNQTIELPCLNRS